jgi:DNA-binding transcriptional LysR family regulator
MSQYSLCIPYRYERVRDNPEMELRHLRYFVAAAEELNISRAAARLRISQPPLSRQIHDLEQEIGAPLFDRRQKRLKLTAAGAYFLPEARKILSHAARAARLAKAAGAGQAGQITIGFVSPLGGLFLPRIIRSFREKFPLVDIDLREMVPRQQLEALLDHHIDLGFLAKTELESMNEFASEPLMEVQLRLALTPGHRLAKLRRVPLAKLQEERFIIFKRSAAPATHDFILRACRSTGLEPNIVKQSDRAQSILDMVAAGVGIAIVPEHFRRYRTELVLRQFNPDLPPLSLCMAWRQNDHSPVLRSLCAMIREHFGSA